MNFFGNCGCNSSCDTLWYIILISLIGNCGCGCGCKGGCQDGCHGGFDDGMRKGGCGCDCGCGCGIDFCTLIILFLIFGCCGSNKCCK